MFFNWMHPSSCPDGEALAEEDNESGDNCVDEEKTQTCTRQKACPDGEAIAVERDKPHLTLAAPWSEGPKPIDGAALKTMKESDMGSAGPEEAEQTKVDKVGRLCKAVRFQLPPNTLRASGADDSLAPFFEIDGFGKCCVGTCVNTCHSQSWISITDNWLLQKQILKEGQGEETRPTFGQEVTMKLLGVLEDGTIIDRDPKLTFRLGDGDVIKLLEYCAFSMQLDEIALVISDGQYAYGHVGRAPDIPPDATVIYEIQLLNVREAADPTQLTPSDCIRICKHKRERGNYYFQRGDYRSAVKSYNLALDILNVSSELKPTAQEAAELQEDGLKCLNNLAAAQLKLNLPEEVIAASDAVLLLDPNNVKALFRKGKLLSEQGDYEAATETLKRALKLEPSTKAIHAELSKLVKKRAGHTHVLKENVSRWQKGSAQPSTHPPTAQESASAVPWKWLFGSAMVAIGCMVTTVVLAAKD
ncbi:FKBP prolyl isomerase 16 isoform X1 [Leucoraja erinacea]|uniref:FKBP prolyl isomerase 16 isoform X1 n=1 Tax=Leucoraja erinaceus TaxID=7782 RepID=UPI002457A1B4|nr:FKBP prolyl isomerase 16 isoform X1 [Leucoraja erinacea]XP_055517009.1 FKBP prolyl isomerase 16 isoform X1 [Leucoraja erinacea]